MVPGSIALRLSEKESDSGRRANHANDFAGEDGVDAAIDTRIILLLLSRGVSLTHRVINAGLVVLGLAGCSSTCIGIPPVQLGTVYAQQQYSCKYSCYGLVGNIGTLFGLVTPTPDHRNTAPKK